MATQELNINKSPADFWRSDNPAIVAWYRFGDSDPVSLERFVADPSPYSDRSYHSGLLIDSGPRQHHLHWGNNELTNISDMVSVVSGIAPASSSGIRFGGNRWTDGTHNSAIWVNPESQTEAGSGGSRGTFGYGTDTLFSGIAVMGWVSIPDTATATTTRRQIFGTHEDTGGTFNQFSVGWYQDNGSESRVIEWLYQDNTGSTRTLTTLGDNFPTTGDEPFFIACTLHREFGDHNWLTSNSSGLLNIYVGTTVSGLRKVSTLEFASTDVRQRRGDAPTQNRVTIAQDSRATRTSTDVQQHLPSGSIMDEWVMVNHGYITEEYMAHYMNSGIDHIVADDPNRKEFIPLEPGDTDLVAYWTFDNQDGINSAPVTSGGPLDMMMFGVTPVDGIRGGSGIRVDSQFSRASSVSAGSATAFPNVSRNSGLNDLFPNVSESDQWTWIGWMRDRVDGSARYGGNVGWIAAGESHTAMGIGHWANGFDSTNNDYVGRGIQGAQSGYNGNIQTAPNVGVDEIGFNERGTVPNAWQLWALVFDYRNGIIYSVRDAQQVHFETQRINLSGFSNERITSNSDSIFAFTAIDGTAAREPEFDDWAIYKRKLTLPEMSGYALSGIAVSPIVGPYSVSDKRTLGCWKLDNSGIFTDPSGDDQLRYDDSSWYVHNLSTVSGIFQTDTTMNSRWGTTSSKVVTSGSMMFVTRAEAGPNLDFSQPTMFEASGFTAGIWLNVPSGDFGTLGDGTSGLYGRHHVMGSWDQADTSRSWQLGILNNAPFISLRYPTLSQELFSSDTIPFNTDFFLAAQITPSGAGVVAELYIGEDPDTSSNFRQIGRSLLSSTSHLNSVGTSGFSILNVPEMAQGFPSGTKVQGAFVYAGPIEAEGLGAVKRAGIGIIERSSGLVSSSDPNNVSFWRMDLPGEKIVDAGRQQNFLTVRNLDDNDYGIVPAFHSSGVVFREAEYLTTRPENPQTRGLNLGSGVDSSFTILGWAKFNEASAVVDDEVICSKHPTLSGGYQIRIPANDSVLILNSAGIETSGNNSTLLDRTSFHHVAVTHDKESNHQTVYMDGRYAGSTFSPLKVIPENTSGFVLGGRGDPSEADPTFGGAGFSGILDDWMVFDRALTLPEISGLAANSYSYSVSSGTVEAGPIGGYISGIGQFFISGLVGGFIHGQAQDIELVGGYVSGVSGQFSHVGGFVHGRAFVSGYHGGFVHGLDQVSGYHGGFIHGRDFVSGYIGAYVYGACDDNGEFDISFTFQILSSDEFDARMAVELTNQKEYDARLGVTIITSPPTCSIIEPSGGTVVSGLPYTLTVQGSGIANNGKTLDRVRFTFADFKESASGTLISGIKDNGRYEATRVLDTSGLYTVKIEVIDEFGYRSACCQQILVMPSGDTLPTSGEYLNSLPGVGLSANLVSGVAKEIVSFTHSLSGLSDISGILEYTDYSDQQESLITSIEMPSGTIFGRQFTAGVRQHEYSAPGLYCPVWAVSGSWGIVSDTVAAGFDVENFI